MSDRPDFLSFPPGDLGERAVKLRILADSDDWVVLDKPEGLATSSPENDPQRIRDLASALRERLLDPSPAYQSIFPAGTTTAVYDLESACSGPVLFAKTRTALASLREQYGSYLWRFHFYIFTRESPAEAKIECDLPVARDPRAGKSYISHRKGKKASTRFAKCGSKDHLQLWEAVSTYLRPHQIRLHAAECGLRIAGETLYGDTPPVSRADLPGQRRPGDARNILIAEPAHYLHALNAPDLAAKPLRSTPRKVYRKCVESLL